MAWARRIPADLPRIVCNRLKSVCGTAACAVQPALFRQRALQRGESGSWYRDSADTQQSGISASKPIGQHETQRLAVQFQKVLSPKNRAQESCQARLCPCCACSSGPQRYSPTRARRGQHRKAAAQQHCTGSSAKRLPPNAQRQPHTPARGRGTEKGAAAAVAAPVQTHAALHHRLLPLATAHRQRDVAPVDVRHASSDSVPRRRDRGVRARWLRHRTYRLAGW